MSLDRLREEVTDTVRVYDPDNLFLGLGKPQDDLLTIARLFLS
ncbi:MAG: tRNA pseudouridine(55) synthase TruB [Clostridia bacterium]|nr:tRNA pseudouridine(55) synthase TruB [Clostridia bacterium]